LRSAFSFIGVTQLDVVAAEGLNAGDAAHRHTTLVQARERIEQTVAALRA
jgi:FMN-dependent NADH-azoreductase